MKTLFLNLFLFVTVISSANEVEQVVIIGSGPAGYTAAIYAARADLNPVIIEGEEGGQITQSFLVENFPGFPDGINGYDLIQLMRKQAERFGTRVWIDKVVAVDFSKQPFKIILESKKVVFSKAVIIATGASPKWLGLPSEQALIGKGVSSCAVCDGAFYRDREVVVVGGGDSALEDALLLSRFAKKVTVIHRRNTLRASEYLKKKAFATPNIEFMWNNEVVEISENSVSHVILKNILDGSVQQYPCDGIFIAIGHTPNSSIFKNLETDKNGYIITKSNSTMTSIQGIFAVGDVTDPTFRQAITAAASGCMAGIAVYNYLQ